MEDIIKVYRGIWFYFVLGNIFFEDDYGRMVCVI